MEYTLLLPCGCQPVHLNTTKIERIFGLSKLLLNYFSEIILLFYLVEWNINQAETGKVLFHLESPIYAICVLDQLNELLKSPKDIAKAVQILIESNNSLNKTVQSYQTKELNQVKDLLVSKIEQNNGVSYLIQQVETPTAEALKNLSFDIQSQHDNMFCLLVAEIATFPRVDGRHVQVVPARTPRFTRPKLIPFVKLGRA